MSLLPEPDASEEAAVSQQLVGSIDLTAQKQSLLSSPEGNSKQSNYWCKSRFPKRCRFQKHKTLDGMSVLADVDIKK